MSHADKIQQEALKHPTKSGVILHGWLTRDPVSGTPHEKRVHYIVAPWSQGRFGDAPTKHYLASKGAIDPGEVSKHAAIREMREETGIDAKPFLAEECRGRIGKVEKSTAMVKEHLTRMYRAEISNIATLLLQLKNKQTLGCNAQTIEDMFGAAVPEAQTVAMRTKNYPTFETLFQKLCEVAEVKALLKKHGRKKLC